MLKFCKLRKRRVCEWARHARPMNTLFHCGSAASSPFRHHKMNEEFGVNDLARGAFEADFDAAHRSASMRHSMHGAARPPGKSVAKPVQPYLQKYSASLVGQIKSSTRAVSSHRGAARDRHERGTGCGGRGCAADEQHVKRTAKSCGSDASTLAFKLVEAIPPATVTTKPDHRLSNAHIFVAEIGED